MRDMADKKAPPSSSTGTQGQGKVPDPGAGEGIRSLRATSLFRAVNFELYAKSNKYVMAFGLIAVTGCVVYIAYLNAGKENERERKLYERYTPDGKRIMTKQTSKWD